MNQIPHIPYAYENVKAACEERLLQLYPAGIPKIAEERLCLELGYLRHHSPGTQDEFEIFRLLFQEARRSMQYLSLEGTDASSYILYLLSHSLANPLPPHYYCPSCGYYEEVQTRLYGIDLPKKECPHCHLPLSGDGFNLPAKTCWGIKGDKIPIIIGSTTEDFLTFAKRILQKIYPTNQIVPMGTMALPHAKNSVCVYPGGFYVLPSGTKMEDYPHLNSYLEDGTPCLCEDWDHMQLLKVTLIPRDHIEHLVRLQTKNGLYLHDISLEDLKDVSWTDLKNTGCLSESITEVLYNIRPRSFYEIATIIAHEKNSFSNEMTPLQGAGFTDYTGTYQIIKNCIHTPFTREDWDDAIQHYEEDIYICYHLAEAIRKGIFYRHRKTGKKQPNHYDVFEKLPTELQEMAGHHKYVCSRSMAVTLSLIFMMLAYYLKTNSKIYSKLVFQQKKESL